MDIDRKENPYASQKIQKKLQTGFFSMGLPENSNFLTLSKLLDDFRNMSMSNMSKQRSAIQLCFHINILFKKFCRNWDRIKIKDTKKPYIRGWPGCMA